MGKLSSATRKRLPSSKFALGGRRYPINDISHARNALSRVAQNGTESEKSKVRAEVHSHFPQIGEAKARVGSRSAVVRQDHGGFGRKYDR